MSSANIASVALPRVAITFCTQCRWMLRAAYFGQELLSTFGTQIGEVALIPATGGVFSVELTCIPLEKMGGGNDVEKVLLWDRKTEGGFPETKILKQLVRDWIDPGRDLGHSDKHGKNKVGVEHVVGQDPAQVQESAEQQKDVKRNADGTVCEDCR